MKLTAEQCSHFSNDSSVGLVVWIDYLRLPIEGLHNCGV
jgi:hypothetical protein